MRDNLEVLGEAPAILLAVKPQTIDDVLAEMGARLARDGTASRKLFISIAAGVPIARIQSQLGGKCRVIRVMPNAPGDGRRGDGRPGSGWRRDQSRRGLRPQAVPRGRRTRSRSTMSACSTR